MELSSTLPCWVKVHLFPLFCCTTIQQNGVLASLDCNAGAVASGLGW